MARNGLVSIRITWLSGILGHAAIISQWTSTIKSPSFYLLFLKPPWLHTTTSWYLYSHDRPQMLLEHKTPTTNGISCHFFSFLCAAFSCSKAAPRIRIALPPLRHHDAGVMLWYPTQSHYPTIEANQSLSYYSNSDYCSSSYTHLSGKKPHRQGSMDTMVTSGSLCGVMVRHWPGMLVMWVRLSL